VADWNPTTKEEALNGGNDVVNYSTSKKFTEIAIWEWVIRIRTTRPSVLLTQNHQLILVSFFHYQVNPSFFYGPFTALPARDFSAISTGPLVCNLLF
jgi:hypothetical protein